ncbi:hypothetical protein B0A48_05086 [Cryoendolithus antarcticus]|uniref:Uncharacterized protein n=1 Tax=Cryoendolithus antarcticus TaxID=1507870 RepID=A0A1V8TEI7_9PEZI|nr:hypothetical protein B0A48_05086 [Cryoendolithus antarcticus]
MNSGVRKTSSQSGGPRSAERSRSRIGSRALSGSHTTSTVNVSVTPLTSTWDNETSTLERSISEPIRPWDIGFRSGESRVYKINDYKTPNPLPTLPHDEWIDVQKQLMLDTQLDFTLADNPGVWPKLHVDHGALVDLLDKALRKTQDIVYHAAVIALPAKHRQAFIRGPRSIVLGREELSRMFGGSWGKELTLGDDELTRYSKLGGAPPDLVNHAITQIIDIRNADAHQQDLRSTFIDQSLRTVQYLAILLQDKKRAEELRKLRNSLAELLRDAFTQNTDEYKESLETKPGYEDPGHAAYHPQWAFHHQRTFIQILSDIEDGSISDNEYPAIVQAAAKKWSSDPTTICDTVNPW